MMLTVGNDGRYAPCFMEGRRVCERRDGTQKILSVCANAVASSRPTTAVSTLNGAFTMHDSVGVMVLSSFAVATSISFLAPVIIRGWHDK